MLTDGNGAVIYAAQIAAATSGLASLVARSSRKAGGMPEWLKGTDCKSVGSAYVGSNPTPSTIPDRILTTRGYSSMVEQQPSKLNTRVRFPLPAPAFPILIFCLDVLVLFDGVLSLI